MISNEKYNSKKQEILDTIDILKHSLFDEQGNLFPASAYGGGESDRDNKLKLLRFYESELKELEDYKPVYGMTRVLRKKEVPEEIKKKIEANRDSIFPITLFTIDHQSIIVPSKYCFIQYPDGEFHETYVMYKGYSEEFKTDFFAYLDNHTGQIMFTPTIMKENSIMKNPQHTQEMIDSFSKQYSLEMQKLSEMYKSNSANLEKMFSSIPSVVGCSTVDQYEYVEVDAPMGMSAPGPDVAYQSMIPPISPKNRSEIKGRFRYKFEEDYLLRWKNGFPWNYEEFYDFSTKKKFYITEPIKSDINAAYLTRISEEEYKSLKSIYSCSASNLIVDLNDINSYIEQLIFDNPGLEIEFYKDGTKNAYLAKTNYELEDLNFKNISKFGVDRDGYIVEKSHAILKHKRMPNNQYFDTECCVYVDAEIGRFLAKENPIQKNDESISEIYKILYSLAEQIKNNSETIDLIRKALEIYGIDPNKKM